MDYKSDGEKGEMKIEVGDWVRFRYDGQLVISEVLYIFECNHYPYKYASTGVADVAIMDDRIFEVRKPNREAK